MRGFGQIFLVGLEKGEDLFEDPDARANDFDWGGFLCLGRLDVFHHFQKFEYGLAVEELVGCFEGEVQGGEILPKNVEDLGGILLFAQLSYNLTHVTVICSEDSFKTSYFIYYFILT